MTGPDAAAATLAGFLEASGARSVTALLETDAGAALVECDESGGAWVTEGDEPRPAGEAPALEVPHVHAFGLIEVDATRAELTAPMGAIAHLAGATSALAETLGGRSVVTAEFATTDPVSPLTIAARTGDPVILALGEEQFEMPPGWPG